MAVIVDEEARALAWQQDQVRRAQTVRQCALARQGSPDAQRALLINWNPLTRSLQEYGQRDNFRFGSKQAND